MSPTNILTLMKVIMFHLMGVEKYPFIVKPSFNNITLLEILIRDLRGTGTVSGKQVLECVISIYQKALNLVYNSINFNDYCGYTAKTDEIFQKVLYLLVKHGMLLPSVVQTTTSDPNILFNFFTFSIESKKLSSDKVYPLVSALYDNLFDNGKLALLDKFLRKMFNNNIFSPSKFEEILGKVFRYFFLKSDILVFNYFTIFDTLKYPQWLSKLFIKTLITMFGEYPKTGSRRMIYLMMNGVLPKSWQSLGVITSEKYLSRHPSGKEVLYYAYMIIKSEYCLQKYEYNERSFVRTYEEGLFRGLPCDILLQILSFLLMY